MGTCTRERGYSVWSILKSWAIEPPSGAEYDAAYIVRLADEVGSTRELVIEFAAPSTLTSVGFAEEIARRFKGDRELPSHVVVDVQRNVRIAGTEDVEVLERPSSVAVRALSKASEQTS
jgi:hypothetical protein